MKLSELYAVLEEVAPVSLSEEFCRVYGAYDNSGVLIDCGAEINGALFSLDFSLAAITEAKKRGFNAIVTHHPAIFRGITKLNISSDPQAKAIERCVKGNISVISMHLNYDAAPEGIDYYLMKGLGGENAVIMNVLSRGGYGRVYDVPSADFASFVQAAKTTFDTERLVSYGGLKKKIGRAASFCGAGCDDNAIAFALENGADVFVSSDLKHHQITALLERGVNVIQLPHYAAEVYGFKRIVQKMNDRIAVPTCFYREKGLQ